MPTARASLRGLTTTCSGMPATNSMIGWCSSRSLSRSSGSCPRPAPNPVPWSRSTASRRCEPSGVLHPLWGSHPRLNTSIRMHLGVPRQTRVEATAPSGGRPSALLQETTRRAPPRAARVSMRARAGALRDARLRKQQNSRGLKMCPFLPSPPPSPPVLPP